MRRISLWFLSTVAVVTLLFGYHTSTSGPTPTATQAPAAPAAGSTVTGTVASVTVIGDALTAIDVDATAAFALGADGERWLATRGHRRAFVVRSDGTTGTL